MVNLNDYENSCQRVGTVTKCSSVLYLKDTSTFKVDNLYHKVGIIKLIEQSKSRSFFVTTTTSVQDFPQNLIIYSLFS